VEKGKEEGGFLRGPLIHQMLHQRRGGAGPPWAETEQPTAQKRCWLKTRNLSCNMYNVGGNVLSSSTGEVERRRWIQPRTCWPTEREGLRESCYPFPQQL